jgi:type IV pilus assembly protein PilV
MIIRKQLQVVTSFKNNVGGFTLIEVLVALLILAVGVMGIVALQFKTLQYSYDANLRSQVNFLAYDISDRMRGNRANAATYVSDANNNYVVGTSVSAGTCTQATGASAANDMICWRQQIFQAMPPNSTASISGPVASLYTIALAWTDRSGQTHTVNYTFQP